MLADSLNKGTVLRDQLHQAAETGIWPIPYELKSMLGKAPEAKLGNLHPEFRGRRHRDHLHAQLLSSCSGQNLVPCTPGS